MRILKKGSQVLLVFLIIISIVTPSISYGENTNVDKFSKSSILIDQDTGRVLYGKNPDEKRPLASLSKMMTFLIAIEAINNKEVNPQDIIVVDKDIAKVRGSSYKLKEGEEVPLIELMKGLMIVSGNDAAVAISKHIGKSEEKFVERMNKKAKEIGMTSTSFVNCNGLPIYSLSDPKKPPKENISTARDIAKLGKFMMDNYEKEVTAITDMQTYTYSKRGFCKNNTNGLLSIIPEVDGIKTGYTGNAGYCLAFSMKINEDTKNIENRLIGVSLGANHKNKRIQACLAMLKYGKENFTTQKVMSKEDLIGKKYLKGLEELEITLESKEDLIIVKKNDENINTQLTFKEIKLPIKKGDVLGVIKYYNDDGEILGASKIVSREDLSNISLKTRMKILFAD
ncbi:MAG: D-alanyl-D-alanine carboxypeptidase family protein [Terrisporobacter othiniensis]|nr:D-alanyl-D-alanine carboxypeptidase family protein [Terrisporobacter petrolearius]MDU4862082.1 D-alanyl-D-alanine carboxypeptidase family protein [Terrisporobacter othiniensis]MDU6995718.1 D-alanyl-D-alanine carboxypeptidase family protein [Terrisporobacter othiniensis]UPA31652.1 D-alanyl-D-alanine carboxypeptidase [Terrisporobacter glycolicus]